MRFFSIFLLATAVLTLPPEAAPAETEAAAVPCGTRCAEVTIGGVSAADEARLLELVRLAPGSVVSARRVSAALESMVRYFADRGYPFCEAVLEDAVTLEEGVRLGFGIDRGRFVRLGAVSYPGARVTRPRVLERLTGLAPGQPYSESALDSAPRRLVASGLFRRVSEPDLTSPGPGLADASLKVEEAPPHVVEASLGSGGGVSGMVHLEFANLFGTARSASVHWQRPRSEWQSLELAWREPWLLGSGISVEGSFSQQVRDSLYTDTGGELIFSVPLGEHFVAGLGGDFRRASPGSETYEGAESSTWWALASRARYSRLDSPLNPSRGLELGLRASLGRRETAGTTAREVRASAISGVFFPLGRGRRHVLAALSGFSLVSRGGSTPAEIPFHARIPAGGVLRHDRGAAVRGYLEEEYRGRRAGWLNLEYRLLAGGGGRLFAFYDLAGVEVPSSAPVSDSWSTELLQGYGAGMRFETRLGLAGLAVAFPAGRGLDEGRIHLELTEHF